MGEPSYSWTVPNVFSENCKFKVALISAPTGLIILYGSDESDGVFTIVYGQLYFVKDMDIKLLLHGDNEIPLIHQAGTYSIYPSASDAGEKLAFVQVERGSELEIPIWNTSEIWLTDYTGKARTRITVNDVLDVEPSISRDGSKVVFVRFDKNLTFSNLFLWEQIGPYATTVQLTSGEQYDRSPCFSPDGSKIVFSSDRDGHFQLYTLEVENPENVQRALPAKSPYNVWNLTEPDWSSDGKWFAFTAIKSITEAEIYVADALGSVDSRRVFVLTSTSPSIYEVKSYPAWCPDGLTIVYVNITETLDGYNYELWSVKVKTDEGVEVIGKNKRAFIGYFGRIFRGSVFYYPVGDPCWRKLEGLRIVEEKLEGRVNHSVDVTLHAIGGVTPYKWNLIGTLPPGLSLSSDGKIYGMPTETAKDHQFTLNVSDSIGLSTAKDLTITIKPENSLELLTTNRFLPPAVAYSDYSTFVRFKGGLSPYTVDVTSTIIGMDLPEGLQWTMRTFEDGVVVELWADSGAGGMPAGRYKVGVAITDDFGDRVDGSFDLSVIKVSGWWMWDSFGEKFGVDVLGLPDYPSEWLKERLTVSLEARSIEQVFAIQDVREYHSYFEDKHILELKYPLDFGAWESVFNPGESTFPGNLKVTLTLEGADATTTCTFPIHRYMFRRDRGFSFTNFGTQGISWEDFVDFFGHWETCWFGVESWPRPIPYAIWHIGRRLISGGMCFGICLSANNIAEDYARSMWSNYPNLPYGQPFDQRLSEPHEYPPDYIQKQHWWQVSMEFIRRWARAVASNWDNWAPAVVADVQDYVNKVNRGENPDPLLIGMKYESLKKGHFLVPYALEYLNESTVLIKVYDPNKPFEYDESSDQNSTIYVDLSQDNAWQYDMGGGEIWKNDWLYTLEWKDFHGDPDLPGLINIPELAEIGLTALFDIVFASGPADTEQITDEEGRQMYTLDGKINTDPNTEMRDCLFLPLSGDFSDDSLQLYCASANKTYYFDIKGTKDGNWTFYHIPMNGTMIGFNIDTSNSTKDRLGINAEKLTATYSTHDAKKFSYKMIREFQESGRVFSISDIETNGNGNVTFIAHQNGDYVVITNNGDATSYDLEIDSVGAQSQAFTQRGIYIGRGEAHRITPTSWENLSQSAIYIDIDRNHDGIWDERKLLNVGEQPWAPTTLFILIGIVTALCILTGIAIAVFRRKKGQTLRGRNMRAHNEF